MQFRVELDAGGVRVEDRARARARGRAPSRARRPSRCRAARRRSRPAPRSGRAPKRASRARRTPLPGSSRSRPRRGRRRDRTRRPRRCGRTRAGRRSGRAGCARRCAATAGSAPGAGGRAAQPIHSAAAARATIARSPCARASELHSGDGTADFGDLEHRGPPRSREASRADTALTRRATKESCTRGRSRRSARARR